MSRYFDLFPRIPYNIEGKYLSNFQNVTNIFFRFRILREVLSNTSSYYDYLVKDGETPEIIAENAYDDIEAHWIILMANEIVDPQYQWPLDSTSFRKFIVNKYGSVETAKTTVHHYEKVIVREESVTGTLTETRFVINEDKLTDNDLDVPYDYYESLAEEQSVETINMGNGKTVIQTTSRDAISCYDYEQALNESRRNIRVIKREYYGQILSEFNAMTKYSNSPFLRKLV